MNSDSDCFLICSSTSSITLVLYNNLEGVGTILIDAQDDITLICIGSTQSHYTAKNDALFPTVLQRFLYLRKRFLLTDAFFVSI